MSNYVNIENLTPAILYAEVDGEMAPVIAATFYDLRRSIEHDVSHVIKCEDCEYWQSSSEDSGMCRMFSLEQGSGDSDGERLVYTEPDDYCSFAAERGNYQGF